jgi:hypothetical protein
LAEVNEDDDVSRLLEEVRAAIAFDQPLLMANIEAGRIVVEGTYFVTSTTEIHAGAIAQYRIRMVLDGRYPSVEPIVTEIGGDIPHEIDFHVNKNGTCCIEIWERWTAAASDISVAAYIDGPLKNFFLSQHIKKTTGKWPFDEWKHGHEGLIQAFAQLLGCAPKKPRVRFFLNGLSGWSGVRPPANRRPCPCGSGIVFRGCCRRRLMALESRISRQAAEKMLERLDMYD